ncbi:MAG: NAD(P)/FAD-dependent oxidoreductase [Planctomycetota bacterium]
MTESLWLTEAPTLPTEPRPLEEPCEVAIFGGGIAGVSTALALARAGVATVLLEAGQVASRASGRNDGQMLLGLGEHYNRIVGQFGRERARILWEYIRDNNARMKSEIERSQIPCDLRASGGLRLAETAHELAELSEASALLAEDGIEHRLLDADAARAELPHSRGFFGALHLPGEAIVQPVTMVRGFAAAARAAGARIVEQAEVTRYERSANRMSIELRDGRRLSSDVVVHCTSTLARTLDPSGFLKAQVFPFRGQILATETLPNELASGFPHYAMSSNFCYEYFRMHDRRFVVGGMRWSVPGEQLGILDDRSFEPRVSERLLDYVGRHFPALAGRSFPHVWTGIMAGTSDGLPLLGALPGRPGEFALLGFNGYGLSFAFLAGHSLAEQIVDGRARHEAAAMFAPRRFA